MARVILVTGAAGFAGSHLLDLLASEPADNDRPGRLAPARRPPSAYRPRARRPDGRPSIFWIEPRHRRDRATAARGSSITAPARPTSAGPGTAPKRHSPTNVRGTHHLLDGACIGPARDARVLDSELGARLSAGRRAADRRSSARAGQPVRLEQARAGTASAVIPLGTRCRSPSRGRSTTSVRGRIPRSPRPASRGRLPRSRRGGSRPRSSSATSTRGATSPTSATPSGRTAMIAERGQAGRAYNVCSGTRRRHSGSARDARRARARPDSCARRPGTLPAERRAAAARRSARDSRGARLDAASAARATLDDAPELLARRDCDEGYDVAKIKRTSDFRRTSWRHFPSSSISARSKPTTRRHRRPGESTAAPPRSPKPKRAPTRPAIRKSPAARR